MFLFLFLVVVHCLVLFGRLGPRHTLTSLVVDVLFSGLKEFLRLIKLNSHNLAGYSQLGEPTLGSSTYLIHMAWSVV